MMELPDSVVTPLNVAGVFGRSANDALTEPDAQEMFSTGAVPASTLP
jgi:hypothetical protein